MTLEQLLAIMPKLGAIRAANYLPFLKEAMVEGLINTPARQAAFLAQLAHESVELRYMEEIASGKAYDVAVNPTLANRLGNDQPGDGVKYKGRGPIQITGKANYAAVGQALGVDFIAEPALLAQAEYAFRAAVWYWVSRKLSALADLDTEESYKSITKKINGGYNGWDSRLVYWHRARKALGLE